MCKNPNSPYLVGLPKTGNKALVFKSNCDSWECPECAKRKQSQWCARAILGCQSIRSNGSVVQFITITSHEKLNSFAATAAVFPHAWSMLYKRMKRQTPDLQYLLMIELHKKNDRIHAHFLTNCDCSKSWFKKNARQCGLGYQADARKVEDDGAAAGYTSKYLAKSLGGQQLPPHFRRIRCSQNWTPLAQLEANEHSCDYDWLVCNTHHTLWLAVEECQKTRTTMIDGATGEYFDYGDAVDTWYH